MSVPQRAKATSTSKAKANAADVCGSHPCAKNAQGWGTLRVFGTGSQGQNQSQTQHHGERTGVSVLHMRLFCRPWRDLVRLSSSYPGLTPWDAFCRRFAAVVWWFVLALPLPFEAPHPLGLKPGSICDAYAALKRRSSTVARASVAARKSPLLAKDARNGAPRSESRSTSKSNSTSKATDRSVRSTWAAVAAGDPSLRLKNGCTRDDAFRGVTGKSQKQWE